MSLSVETIKELQKAELAKQVQVEVSANKLISQVVALPNGVSLRNLEEFSEFKDRFEYHFDTDSIKDYGTYCDEFAIEGTKCFVNGDEMSAQTIFDLGTKENPLHQVNDAQLKLKKTAAYCALLKTNGLRLKQKDAANFLEDWGEHITVYSDEETKLSIHQASKRIRELKIEAIASRETRVSDYGETRSGFEQIEAKDQETLPSELHFICKPYQGLSDRAFVLKMAILTGEDKPLIVFRIIKLEAQQEDIVEEFKEVVTKVFTNNEIKVFIGS